MNTGLKGITEGVSNQIVRRGIEKGLEMEGEEGNEVSEEGEDFLYNLSLGSPGFRPISYEEGEDIAEETKDKKQMKKEIEGINEKEGGEEEDKKVYNSEAEMIAALTMASMDPNYLEASQRCCKVLIKIANLAVAKHFFWEIDSVMFPDYYSSIRRPMMITNVTSNLIEKSYGDDGDTIMRLFYRDMRQVVLNCLAYNTEVTAVSAQAQKLSLTLSLILSLTLSLSLTPSLTLTLTLTLILTLTVTLILTLILTLTLTLTDNSSQRSSSKAIPVTVAPLSKLGAPSNCLPP
jgi:hypothetical protein